MLSIANSRVRSGSSTRFFISFLHFSPFIICSRILSSWFVPKSHLSAFDLSRSKYSSTDSSICCIKENSKRSTHLFGFSI
uniref:Uncharacterized protein n=1 Tax=Octopus bimaculoides TaxID=37653 RepID=A0A0L8HY45_OCTBM